MYGLNVDPRNPQGDPVPDRLRALGVEIVRYTFKDATLGQLPDRDVVGFYRRYVEALAMAGVKSLVVLTGETWAGRPEPSASKEAWDHYLVGFARRIAAILATGQTNSVRITVRNTTFKTWPSGGPYPVRLGYHIIEKCLGPKRYINGCVTTRSSIKRLNPLRFSIYE